MSDPARMVLLEGEEMLPARRLLMTWPLVHAIAQKGRRHTRWAIVAQVDELTVADLEEFLLAHGFIHPDGTIDNDARTYIAAMFAARVRASAGRRAT